MAAATGCGKTEIKITVKFWKRVTGRMVGPSYTKREHAGRATGLDQKIQSFRSPLQDDGKVIGLD